jgi:uncharacterized membrane protein
MSDPVQQKGVSTILLVSLCFNFFLAGIVVLGTLRAIGHNHPPIPMRQLLMPQAVKLLLPAGDQEKLDSVIAAHRDAVMKYRDQAIDARAEAFRDFTAAKFDDASYLADLEKMRAADSALEEEAIKSMAETAAKLSPEERQMVADHLKRELWRSRWKMGRRGE